MIGDGFEAALAAALARARDRAVAAVARDLPGDVTAAAVERGVVLRGRRLGWRALTDARLRDFAGRVR